MDITEEHQALKVIQLTRIRCSNPNRVAQFINEKFKFHNLADMWQALCAVVDGRGDQPLLLAVDAASYEAYMGGRTNTQAALKGVAMSMKVEECRWGTVTCHIAKDQATPISRTRPGKGGDPAVNSPLQVTLGSQPASYTHNDPMETHNALYISVGYG